MFHLDDDIKYVLQTAGIVAVFFWREIRDWFTASSKGKDAREKRIQAIEVEIETLKAFRQAFQNEIENIGDKASRSDNRSRDNQIKIDSIKENVSGFGAQLGELYRLLVNRKDT